MASASLVVAATIGLMVLGAVALDVLNTTSRTLHRLKFRLRRLCNWLPTALAYALFYCCRYNVAAGNVPEVQAELGLSASDFAVVITTGYWAYGLTAPFTGLATDRLGAKAAVLISCLGCAAVNLALGLLFNSGVLQAARPSVALPVFSTLFALNFALQGFGTSAVVKMNALWFRPRERGTFSGLYNVVLSSGYYLSLGVGPSVIKSAGWQWVFIAPACGLFLFSVIIACFVTSSPRGDYALLDGGGEGGGEGGREGGGEGGGDDLNLENAATPAGSGDAKFGRESKGESKGESDDAGGPLSSAATAPRTTATTATTAKTTTTKTTTTKTSLTIKTTRRARTASAADILGGRLRPLEDSLLGEEDATVRSCCRGCRRTQRPRGGVAAVDAAGGGGGGGSAFCGLVRNPAFVCYLCAVFFLCWVRDGLITWIFLYLRDARGPGATLSGDATALIGGAVTIGGIVGGVLTGWLSDVVFAGKRLPPIIIFTCLQVIALVGLWLVRAASDLAVAGIVFALCICILGCYTLLSYTIPTDLPSHVVGLAAGMMTAVGYIASGLSAIVLREIIDHGGFFAWWCSLMVATVCAGGFVLLGACYNTPAKIHPADAAANAANERVGNGLSALEEGRAAHSPRGAGGRNGGGAGGASLVRGFGGDIISLPYATPVEHNISRMAGIQDELLRVRNGKDGRSEFELWDSKGTAAERMLWRIGSPIPGDTSTEPEQRSRKFLQARQNDPTSYFGTRTAMHLC